MLKAISFLSQESSLTMEDFLSRFSDSLIFDHSKNLFSFEEVEDDKQPILKNPKTSPNPNPKPKLKPGYQNKFLSHIFKSLHSLTIAKIYPDYGTLIVSIINHKRSFDSKIRNLSTFLSKAPNKNDKVEDIEFFLKQFRDYIADIEKEMECLETQLQDVEKKLKLGFMLMDLKLNDSSKRATKMRLLEVVRGSKTNLKVTKMVLHAHKTMYEFNLLGVKGLISNDVGASDSASAGRILHRFNWGNSSITLHFRTLPEDSK